MATEAGEPSLEQKFTRILCGHFKDYFYSPPGAVDRDWTDDLDITNIVLYQLSYNGKQLYNTNTIVTTYQNSYNGETYLVILDYLSLFCKKKFLFKE